LKKKVLIVGHGLAGAILAQEFLKQEVDVQVIDASIPHSASSVSAGLINPFIGPKLNLPTDFKVCIEATVSFFAEIEHSFGKKFLHTVQLFRIFTSMKQAALWPLLESSYAGKLLQDVDCEKLGLIAEHGAGITEAWRVDTQELIACLRAQLEAENIFQPISFNEEDWKGWTVIFCEGFRAIENPWFFGLPFAPAQGEVLTIETRHNRNLSNGTWHLPLPCGEKAWVGSTWKHEDLESGPTGAAKEEILRRLGFLRLQYSEVMEHKSGVRSGTIDRNPILGRHWEIPHFMIFNGFGSRGCTTIPYSARKMVELVMNEIPLPRHIDLSRLIKKD